MPKAETITSAANPLLKEVRRAVRRGSLTEGGWAVAETFHLLDEALRSACEMKMVLAAESALPELDRLPGRDRIRVVALADKLFQSISGTETAQGVIALVKPREWKLEELFGAAPLVVVLDGMQDPGNAGAILRAAEAFGATGALLLKGTASPYNPKTLRASAGSLFRRAVCARHGSGGRARGAGSAPCGFVRRRSRAPRRNFAPAVGNRFRVPVRLDYRRRGARRGRATPAGGDRSFHSHRRRGVSERRRGGRHSALRGAPAEELRA